MAVIDIDHPAVGAGHVFLSGSADSLVAAALLISRSRWPSWVMVAREHRLPVLLERPITDAAAEIWCLGFAGTGNPLLPAAIEAHVTHRAFWWCSSTTGRLEMAAGDLPGVHFLSLPGGSLVHLVHSQYARPGEEIDAHYVRLGHILGRSRGARPTDRELALANRLHAASVLVRNNEGKGPELVRALAEHEPNGWMQLPSLEQMAAAGEQRIHRSRLALAESPPTRGDRHGPALWILPPGKIARGAHGKAVAARAYARQAPVALIERPERGFTKAWIVLPKHAQNRWLDIVEAFAFHTLDFSYTGLRGAGSLPSAEVDTLAERLWRVFGTG